MAASAVYLSRLVPEKRWTLRGVKHTKAFVAWLTKHGLAQRHDVTVVDHFGPGYRNTARIASQPLLFDVVVRGPMTEDEARKLDYEFNHFHGRSGGGEASLAHGETGEEHRHELGDWRQFTVEFLIPARLETEQEYAERRARTQKEAQEALKVSPENGYWQAVAKDPTRALGPRRKIWLGTRGLTDALRQAFYDEFGAHKYGRVSNERHHYAGSRKGGIAKFTQGQTPEGTRIWFVLEIRVGPDEAIPADNSSGHVFNAIKAGMRAQGWDVPKLRVVQRRSWSER